MNHLTTPRLQLRDWRDEDLDTFAALNADPRVMEYFPSPLTRSESAAFLERIRHEIETEPFGSYAVERRADNLLIGYVGLHRISFEGPIKGCVEIGWRLHPDAWGAGYATEAARACLEQAQRLGIEPVYAFTTCTNQRSERVMQRLGLVRQHEFDHPARPAGHPLRRHVLYATK